MSKDTFVIVQGMDLKNMETQLVLQCAPVITGLKISNLFIIQNSNLCHVRQILHSTGILYYVLLVTNQKTILLLYNKNRLEAYLKEDKVAEFLRDMGYQKLNLNKILSIFQARYQKYMVDNISFPHEMGLLLGYPVEDVEGFIKNEGKNFLCNGYWKVYEDLYEKVKLFHQFELATETLIRLLASGTGMADIIHYYREKELQKAAV